MGSLTYRKNWGIADNKLGEIFFSPRQKSFEHGTRCFNKDHILRERIKTDKTSIGLVAIQLDLANAYDTIPHEAIQAALERLELPTCVRESIKFVGSLTSTIEYVGQKTKISLPRRFKQGDLPHPSSLTQL